MGLNREEEKKEKGRLASAKFYNKKRDEMEDLTLIVEDLAAENEELAEEVGRLNEITVKKDKESGRLR